MSTFLDRAMALHTQGYRVIPIKPGKKGPVLDNWQALKATTAQIEGWARNGYANGNIGIITADTPAVDIDVYDADLAQELEEWMVRTFGSDLLIRVGQAPKRLILFRTRMPFKKMICEYADAAGKKHKIEVLADGQQFVAYGTHPDTGGDYTWTSFDEPTAIPASTLPELTAADIGLIFDKFEALAKNAGWKRINRTGEMRSNDSDGGDALERFKPIMPITLDQVKETLSFIRNENADYEDYMVVGFALHHQFDGDSAGLELWHEWAQQSDKYVAADLNRRWESMGHGPDTATFATLHYRAQQARKHEARRELEKSITRINLAPDTDVLYNEIIPALARLTLEDAEMDVLVAMVQDRAKELTTKKPRLESIRKKLREARPKREMTARNAPAWCNHWYFVTAHTQFYNISSGERMSPKAFDAVYGRELMTDEQRAQLDSFPGKPSDAALNLYEIPTVYDYVYLPGEGELVIMNRRRYVNLYNLNSLPEARSPASADDYKAITAVEKHFAILFPDDRERRIFMDFLAYNVQYPAEKITWAVLIQGVDGAGKSWFSRLMAHCLGGDNVRNLPGESLKEKFTSTLTGRKMVFVEEVRMHGANKYEVIDRMKPFVTNESVGVRAMRTESEEVPHVTNYVMFTNHADALPIDVNDRRYFIIRTCFLTKSHIDQFNRENPTYFSDLFELLTWHGDVIRDYFMKHSISNSFNAKGHAPDTHAKTMMRENAMLDDDDSASLEEILADEDPEVNAKVLNSVKLRQTGQFVMSSRQFGMFLERCGFVKIGKFRVDGFTQCTYYTRHSELFNVPEDQKLGVLRALIAKPFDDGFGDET